MSDQLVGTPPSRRERILEAADDLMTTNGFHGASVDQICDRAGVTKGAFFHHFDNKDALGIALVQRFAMRLFQSFQGDPSRAKNDPFDRVLGYIEWTKEVCRGPLLANGCLLGIFSQELSTARPEIRAECSRSFEGWAVDFARLLDDAKHRYAPRSRIDTTALAHHFIAVVEGALILAKAHQQPDLIDSSLDRFADLVRELLGKGRKGGR